MPSYNLQKAIYNQLQALTVDVYDAVPQGNKYPYVVVGEDTFYPVSPAEVHGTTIDVGGDITTPTDDTVISPNTAVCSTCHADQLAADHMQQNGGDFNATKAADSALISSGVETCAICHGPGRTSDVKEVHGVAEFQFN